MVASEFPLAHIVGIDLSRELLAVARLNAAAIAQRFPQRTPIHVVDDDASQFPPADERLVIVLFNPFPREVGEPFVCALERSEVGFGPDLADTVTVTVWRSSPARFTSLPGAQRGVAIDEGGWYAKLKDAQAA